MSSAVARTASPRPEHLEDAVEGRAQLGGVDLDAELLAGRHRQDVPILVAGRVEPPIERDRRGRANGRGVRVGRLAELGQLTHDDRWQRFDVEHRLGRRGHAGRLVRRPQGEDVPVGDRVHGRGGHLQVGQVPPPELEAHRLPLPAAEREDLVGHRHRAHHEAIDGAASPLIPRVGQLDHVVGVLGEDRRQASIGQQPRRVVGRGDVGPPGRRQADRRVDPRADPGTLRIDDDPLPLLPREPEVIDIIARRLPLDDHRARDRLGRLERVILLLLGDLRELADGEEEGVGQPVIGLDPDRIDPDGQSRPPR